MTEAEAERRALAIFERLAGRSGNTRFRERLMRRETPRVAERVAALERSSRGAALSMPTEIEGARGSGPSAPERIGPFRLVEPIGEGGMGAVWRGVRDDGLYDQQVAVKLLHDHLTQLAGSRFAAERRILAKLEHPSIARLIDGGVTGEGTPYLIMEYVDGEPIDAVAAGLPLRRRIDLYLKTADAVAFAHSRLVVHADLKPSNILVSGAGWVKLLDFGIARLIDSEGDGEAPQHPMTRAYASPARIGGAAPTIADDVFALGVILRDLLSDGQEPDLGAVAAKAMAPEPDRYGSVAALVADVERWRQHLPVSARPASWRYRTSRFIARHRIGVAATGSALLILTGASLAATYSYIEAERARAEASARFDDVRGTARYLLFDLYDRLERLPGSLPLRADVAKASQLYLARLSSSPSAPADVRLEATAGLIRLAERQGAPGRPNLGAREAARASLNRAIDGLAGMESAQARRLRGQALIARAELENQVFSDLDAAERSLAAARPIVAQSAPELRPDYFIKLGRLRRQQSRYPEAITAARQAIHAARRGQPHERMMIAAAATELMADSNWYASEDPKEPVRLYREAVGLREAIVRRFPEDVGARSRLVSAQYGLAFPLVTAGEPREAEHLLAKAAAQAKALSEREPTDQEAARTSRVVAGAHAQVLAVNGEVDRAAGILLALIDQRRREWAAAPAESRRLRDLAINIAMLADMEAEAGRTANACPRYREVLALFDRLKTMQRHIALDEGNAVRLAKENQAKYCAG